MKAKQYYERFAYRLLNKNTPETNVAAVLILLEDFDKETIELFKIRNCVRNSASLAILKEQNQKWNAIVSLFEHRNGQSPLRRNGYGELWEKKLPYLKGQII